MSLNNFLLYLTAGRLLTWLLQNTGLLRPLWQSHPMLKELSGCDLCLGFWVYLGLAHQKTSGLKIASDGSHFAPNRTFKLWRWKDRPFGLWHPLVERVVLAALASFGAHLLRLGWESKFGMVID